jgi:hypothetical protein
MNSTSLARQPIQKEETAKYRPGRAISVAMLVLVTVLTLAALCAAADGAAAKPTLTISQFKGSWAAAIVGNTGCGFTSMYVTFTLDANGQGNGTVSSIGHSAGCGDGTGSGDNFNVTAFNANGSGTATLSCGSGCGWTFTIQMAKGGQVFNLVDVDPQNPGNYLAGTAIHQ